MADTLRKREVKPPKRFVADFSSHRSQVGAKRKAAKPDKTLYEIEIIDIDKAQDKVKIHYKGYGSEFDEWRSCVEIGLPIRLEKLRLPGEDSFEDRYNSFYDSLYREIKKKLYSTMRDDPDIRIEMTTDCDVFNNGLASVGKSLIERNRTVFKVKRNKELNNLLGEKWDERILNKNGDFAFVEEGTIKFWLHARDPIKEFKCIGDKYLEAGIEQGPSLIFTFVRGDGNSADYLARKK